MLTDTPEPSPDTWLSQSNPLLSVHLAIGRDHVAQVHFPKVRILILEETEVLFIQGAIRCFDSIKPLIAKGGRVVFIEPNIEKIKAFIRLDDFIRDERIEILLDEEIQYNQIAWKTLFQNQQFVGKLEALKAVLDDIHLAVSDYRDFGSCLLQNVQKNIARTDQYVDGRELEDALLGETIIICGSGLSLKNSIETIKECEGKAWILACGSSIPMLMKEGIQIDFGAFVEPEPPVELYPRFSFPIFYQNRASNDLIAKNGGPNIWMGESGGWPLVQWIECEVGFGSWQFDSGWNVGNFGLNIAKHLGCKKIILIGLDSCIHEDRILTVGEYEKEGKITRRDLDRGISWMNRLIEDNPSLDVIQGFTHLNIESATTNEKWLEAIPEEKGREIELSQSSLDRDLVGKAIGALHNREDESAIETFLDLLRAGVNRDGFIKAKCLLDSQLVGEPLYEYLLLFLWKIFSEVYLREIPENSIKEVGEAIAEANFFLSVIKANVLRDTKYSKGLSQSLMIEGKIEGCVKRYYETKELYSSERYIGGRPDGIWRTYFKDGKLKSEVSFSTGSLEGHFNLFHEDGKKREGNYELGEKEGIHRIWDGDQNLILEGEFEKGNAIGLHKRFSLHGSLVEEIEHLDKNRFNKRTYDEAGDLTYESRFLDQQFSEKRYLKETVIGERKGQWKGGKFEWD